MWSFWLIFCILYALWRMWIRDLYRLPDGKNWLWGKLDLAVVGRTSQFSSVTQSCPTLWPQRLWCQASLSIINSQSLLKLMSIESGMPSNHLILCISLRTYFCFGYIKLIIFWFPTKKHLHFILTTLTISKWSLISYLFSRLPYSSVTNRFFF